MRRLLATSAAAAAVALAVVLAAAPHAEAADAGAPSPPPPVPSCVRVATSSIWVPYGYNHVVTLANGCARPAACTVATDVNPEPQNVLVPAGAAVEVTTFLGAASQTFSARVACQLR